MFVGIMSTRKNLQTRGMAAVDTWIPSINGDVKFFCAGNSSISDSSVIDLPLKEEEDTYPPQRKSFMMLHYMYENLTDNYEWFIRADDDVYIVGDKLIAFLASLDSGVLYYIGQAAFGRKHEKGKLGLSQDMPYCMGGPGVILSRSTLATLGPHIDECMQDVYTDHEDTELGRCIHKFVESSCIDLEQV